MQIDFSKYSLKSLFDRFNQNDEYDSLVAQLQSVADKLISDLPEHTIEIFHHVVSNLQKNDFENLKSWNQRNIKLWDSVEMSDLDTFFTTNKPYPIIDTLVQSSQVILKYCDFIPCDLIDSCNETSTDDVDFDNSTQLIKTYQYSY
jgi:hypothetical protein